MVSKCSRAGCHHGASSPGYPACSLACSCFGLALYQLSRIPEVPLKPSSSSSSGHSAFSVTRLLVEGEPFPHSVGLWQHSKTLMAERYWILTAAPQPGLVSRVTCDAQSSLLPLLGPSSPPAWLKKKLFWKNIDPLLHLKPRETERRPQNPKQAADIATLRCMTSLRKVQK